MKRIHVTLDKNLLAQADQLALCRDQVVAVSGMRDIDEKRLQRYGVLTGTIEEDERLPAIRNVEGVSAVEADEIRYAT
jgi:hypothetical protein